MAGKARVHELAKELGVTSKEVLARLSEQGEFVKSASSTVEAPVARRLRESLGGAKPAAEKAKADGNGAPAKKAAAAKAPAAGEGARNQTRGGQTGGTGTCGARRARGPRASGRGTRGRAGSRTRTAQARHPVHGRPPQAPSPRRAHRASETTRSPRRSRSSGRFRGRRHLDPAPLGPAAARVPASRRATCRPVHPAVPPAGHGRAAAPGPRAGGRGPGGGGGGRPGGWRRRR